MSFDRSKFSGTSTSTLNDQQKAYEDSIPTRGEFHKLKPGNNTVRFICAHPGAPSFIMQKTVVFLELSEETTDAKGAKTRGWKKRPVFNGKVHGNLESDIVEEYLTYAFEYFKENVSDVEKYKSIKDTLLGQDGLKYQTVWAAYAKLNGKCAELDVKPAVKQAMDKIVIMLDNPNSPITVDPFSDPNKGIPLIISFNDKATKPQDYYSAMLSPLGADPLTDEDLQWLMKQETLYAKYKGVYTKSDLLQAIEGLKRFDEKNNYNLFSHTQWLDRVKWYLTQVGEAQQAPATPVQQQPPATPATPVQQAQADPTPTTGEITPIPLEKMSKEQLTLYIISNNIPITVLDIYTTEILVALIKQEELLREKQKAVEVTPSSEEDELEKLKRELGIK